MKKTPLYDEHLRLGGKIVEFAGWQMPVQYSGVVAEHVAVRERVGLFDVSHMGEIWVTGPHAEEALEYMTCNKVSSLYDGKAHYSAILNERGGVVDDIIVYRCSKERFLICVNASNADKDFEWLTKHNATDAKIVNASVEYGQVAVQGPKAIELITPLVTGADLATLKYFHFVECEILGSPVLVARTGYTGEDGVEIFVKADKTADLWRILIEHGASLGLLPCGLGARDSLRLEAALPLHGHELSEDMTALESGLGWIVKFDKGDFIGKEALLRQKNAGLRKKLIGFHLDDAGIARQGDLVSAVDGKEVGVVVSGTKTPTVNKALGMAFVETPHTALDTKLTFVVRGRNIAGHVVQLPFYKRSK
ncbi:MAG: glycine cleavage system aminomethyltransferase GcvT [Pseudomonadota bacterium]|jgi:aminomethyltransferase